MLLEQSGGGAHIVWRSQKKPCWGSNRWALLAESWKMNKQVCTRWNEYRRSLLTSGTVCGKNTEARKSLVRGMGSMESLDRRDMIKDHQPWQILRRPCLPADGLGLCSGGEGGFKLKNKMINLFSGKITEWWVGCKEERLEAGRLEAYEDKKLIWVT